MMRLAPQPCEAHPGKRRKACKTASRGKHQLSKNNLKILIIDDDLNHLQLLKTLLGRALPGSAILTALSGPEGLELARAQDPEVILLDIVMPDMDGLAVCHRLKQD